MRPGRNRYLKRHLYIPNSCSSFLYPKRQKKNEHHRRTLITEQMQRVTFSNPHLNRDTHPRVQSGTRFGNVSKVSQQQVFEVSFSSFRVYHQVSVGSLPGSEWMLRAGSAIVTKIQRQHMKKPGELRAYIINFKRLV